MIQEIRSQKVPNHMLQRNGALFSVCSQQFVLLLISLYLSKLPRISPSLILPTPKSDPSLHQGRVRTSPHVDGQFAAFVYTPVNLTEHTELKAILDQAIEAARDVVPDLKCDWLDVEDPELHISLTRPIYLRDYQREELKRATKIIAQRHSA